MSVTRFHGKPTSGRYVYAARYTSGAQASNAWLWQCDLHDPDVDPYGSFWGGASSQRDAFDLAMAHAVVCPHGNG